MSIDTVLEPGATIEISGSGFDLPRINLFTTEGNLGSILPLGPTEPDRLRFVVPATIPTGPGALQIVSARDWAESNTVSVVLGEALDVASVVQADGAIRVTGAGFSSTSIVNFFAQGPSGLENFGGLDDSGSARLPLTIVSPNELSFPLPSRAQSGPAYVMVVNPPFTEFASTRGDADGALSLSVP